jgi:putative ABC transport system substrate-binding protein
MSFQSQRGLKGAQAGDVPVEQWNKLEIIVNLKTAKMLGIKLPNLVLQRADKVIE